LEEVCGWSNGCGTSFCSPGHSRGVIAKAAGRNVRDWDSRREDIITSNGTGKFKVAVSDGASWILEGDKIVLDRRWERRSPQARLLKAIGLMRGDSKRDIGKRGEPDSTHARFCSIHGTIIRRRSGNNFSKVSRTRRHIFGKPKKVLQLMAHMLCNLDSLGTRPQGMLKEGEAATAARYCE